MHHEQEPPAPGTPLTPEELADRVVPSDPRIFADGRAVVFTASPVGMRGERPERALWLRREGEDARPFTAGTADDHSPRPSPDGKRILFCSDRLHRAEKEYRLFLVPVDGGEACPLGELKGELSTPEWSPDGSAVAVLRKDPETEDEKKRAADRDDAVVVEEHPKWTRLWLVDAGSGRARCLTTGSRQVWGYGWAPDGANLVIATSESPGYDARSRPGDLWLVPQAGGLPCHVARFPVVPSHAVVVESAAGPTVAVRANNHRADPADSVWVVPVTGGEPRNLLPGYAGTVEEIAAWPNTTGRVAVRMVEGVHAGLYGADIGTGALTPIMNAGFHGRGSVLDGISFSADGTRLAMLWSDGTTPEEVHLGEVSGSAAAVSCFGSAFRGRLQPTEVVRWPARDGVEIEGMLTLPAGHRDGHCHPLIVHIHGGPSWQWEDRAMLDWHDWAQLLASHGFAVLQPNPRGSTGRGAAFEKLLQDDVGGGESRDLIDGADAMIARGIADPERLGIGGWSWGGYLTAWTITQTERFRAAAMGAGLANMISDHGQGDIPSFNLLYYPGLPYQHMDAYWRSSPVRYAERVKTPTLILHGDADARVHPAQGMEFYRALKMLGVPVRFVRYPREEHGFKERQHQIDLMGRIVDWYKRWLLDEPAKDDLALDR